jgi:hypothetical protein
LRVSLIDGKAGPDTVDAVARLAHSIAEGVRGAAKTQDQTRAGR